MKSKMSPTLAAGIGLLLGGFVCGGAGGWLMMQAKEAFAEQAGAKERLDAACEAGLRGIGTVSKDGDDLTLTVEVRREPKLALADASSAAAYCPGRRFARACIGEACGEGGANTMVMVLSPP